MKKLRLHIIRDTREQDGFTFQSGFDPAPIVTPGTLATGDYSLAGFEAAGITVERKSLQDLVGVLGHGRERFERELARMRAYAVAAVVVEAPKSALRSGAYRGSLDPKSGEQTVLAFGQRYGVAWHWCTDKADAERTTFDILRHFARDRWKELQALTREWQESEHATT